MKFTGQSGMHERANTDENELDTPISFTKVMSHIQTEVQCGSHGQCQSVKPSVFLRVNKLLLYLFLLPSICRMAAMLFPSHWRRLTTTQLCCSTPIWTMPSPSLLWWVPLHPLLFLCGDGLVSLVKMTWNEQNNWNNRLKYGKYTFSFHAGLSGFV